MYRDFGTILIFALLGIVLVYVPLLIQRLVAPKNPTPDKLSTYECGEEPEGSAWVQFNIRFYVIALIFLIFEVPEQFGDLFFLVGVLRCVTLTFTGFEVSRGTLNTCAQATADLYLWLVHSTRS